jgi:hypothetical protein
MVNSDQPKAEWQWIAAELRAYREAQDQVWGGLDDVVVARYLAGTCTQEEKLRVEGVANERRAVANLLALVREVCDGATVARAADAIIELPAQESREAVRAEPAATVTWNTRGSLWRSPALTRAFAGLAATLLIIVTTLAWLVGSQRNEIQRLSEERESIQAKPHRLESQAQSEGRASRPPIAEPPIHLTGKLAVRPVDWQTTLEVHYRADRSEEENLEQLETVGGDRVRAAIAKLREMLPRPTAKEILAELFKTWGGPTKK